MIHCPKCQTLFDPKTKWGFRKFCSRSCGNSRVRTEEFKQNAREFALANPKGWATNPTNINGAKATKEKWDLLRQTLTCKECQKEFNVPYSQRNKKYCSVGCANKNKYHINSNRKKTCIYNGYKMDSGAELVFAQQCDLHNIQWHKNTTQFFTFVDSKGKSSKYYPDFYLEQYDTWVEIKGRRYIRPDDELRRAAVGKPIFLIISNQFKIDFKRFKEFIGLDTHEHFETKIGGLSRIQTTQQLYVVELGFPITLKPIIAETASLGLLPQCFSSATLSDT